MNAASTGEAPKIHLHLIAPPSTQLIPVLSWGTSVTRLGDFFKVPGKKFSCKSIPKVLWILFVLFWKVQFSSSLRACLFYETILTTILMSLKLAIFISLQKTSLWAQMAILNVATSGKFSSDRTIAEYGREIWWDFIWFRTIPVWPDVGGKK